jgi:hypothetical protein
MEARTSGDSEGGMSVTWHPRVRFTDSTEAVREATSASGSNPPGFARGDVVQILYDPSNPDTFVVDTFGQKWGLPLTLTVLGSVLTAIGVAFLVWG